MAWMITAEDAPGAEVMRADRALMDAMWSYELENRARILLAGSLRADDGMTKTGSLYVIDADTRAEAEAFLVADPATKAGMRGKTCIRYLNAAIVAGEVQG